VKEPCQLINNPPDELQIRNAPIQTGEG